MLQNAAAAGIAVTAASALGAIAASSSAHASTGTHADAAGPLVVHVRDIKTGDIEVFSGTSQTRVRDRALAARIAKAVS